MLPGILNNVSATLAHAEDMRRRTEPQRGGHKEEATHPHTTRHPVRGTHAVPFLLARRGYLVGHRMQSSQADSHNMTGIRDFTHSDNAFILLREAFTKNDLLDLCVGPRHSVLGPATLSPSLSGLGALSLVSDRGQLRSVLGPPAPIRVPPIRSESPQLRSACHPSSPRGPSSDLRATHPAPGSDPRATHPGVPFFQERTPKHTVWGNILMLALVCIRINE